MFIFTHFLYKLYRIKRRSLRKLIVKIVYKLEKGEFYSSTLRKIFITYHGITIGMYSYGGCFSSENIQPNTVIGRYCSFASNVYIYNGNHPTEFKSLHPFFYNPVLLHVNELMINRTTTVIGNDVWIGQNAIILPSVSVIGNGTVIGAGSIVTKNVPPFAIVVGNPAKIMKYRFSDDIINKIEQSAWWDKSIEDLKKNKMDFETFTKPYV
jgi:acetyltransferase-like isoleucine patch superfamily enzyme